MRIVTLREQGHQNPIHDTKAVRNTHIYFMESTKGTMAWAPYLGVVTLISPSEKAFIHQNAVLEISMDNLDYIKSGIYVSEFINKNQLVEQQISNDFKPRHLTILTTAFCSLRCKYCYASGGQLKVPQPTFDAVKYLIDKFDFKAITFHGWGEPTFNWPLIEQVVEYTKGTRVSYDIGSNGIWFNNRQQFTRFFVDNNFSVGLSYDGLPSITDQQRILPDGRTGATNEIMLTVDEFRKYGDINRWLNIRSTVGKRGEKRILDMCKHLKELGFWGADFEPIFFTGRALEHINDIDASPPNIAKFAESLLEAILWGERNGFDARSSLFVRNGNSSCSFCNTTMLEDLVLGPDLTLRGCWEPSFVTSTLGPQITDSPFKIGFLEKTKDVWIHTLDWDRIDALRSRQPQLLPDCPTCPVKCGGGCAKQSWETFGDMTRSGEDRLYCDSRRLLLKNYLETRFEDNTKEDSVGSSERILATELKQMLSTLQSQRGEVKSC